MGNILEKIIKNNTNILIGISTISIIYYIINDYFQKKS
jgi:hypothetical protein